MFSVLLLVVMLGDPFVLDCPYAHASVVCAPIPPYIYIYVLY